MGAAEYRLGSFQDGVSMTSEQHQRALEAACRAYRECDFVSEMLSIEAAIRAYCLSMNLPWRGKTEEKEMSRHTRALRAAAVQLSHYTNNIWDGSESHLKSFKEKAWGIITTYLNELTKTEEKDG